MPTATRTMPATILESRMREDLRKTLVAIDYAMQHGEVLTIDGKRVLAIPAIYQGCIRKWCGDALEQLGFERGGCK